MRIPSVIVPIVLGTAACFPTFQTARVEPGFHVDAGATWIHDQPREGHSQKSDVIGYLEPKFGFKGNFEIGLPVGVYMEEGLNGSSSSFGTGDKNVLLAPYLKIGVLPRDSRDHLALIGQTSWLAPGNVGVRYGRDLGKWEPHVGVSYIFTAGPAGDDPVVTRYQEGGQTLWAFVAGATWKGPGRPGLQVGVLRNSYRDGTVYGDFGQPAQVRTLYDLFVGIRVGTGR
jgi:hypothetical protein